MIPFVVYAGRLPQNIIPDMQAGTIITNNLLLLLLLLLLLSLLISLLLSLDRGENLRWEPPGCLLGAFWVPPGEIER